MRRMFRTVVPLVIALGTLASRDAMAQQATTTTETTEEPVEAVPAKPKPLDPDEVEPDKAVFILGDLGFTRADLGAIVDDTGFDRTGANGLQYGVSAGLRNKGFRYGIRWRVYDTTEFSLWSFAAMAGYALPMRPISPIFAAHLGYVFDHTLQSGLFRSSLPQGTILDPSVDVKGLMLGLDLSASYWVTNWFRLAPFVDVDFMFLSREQANPPPTLFGPSPETSNIPLYKEAGFGLGLNVNLGVRASFDIGYR
jgi:hypothetical protein